VGRFRRRRTSAAFLKSCGFTIAAKASSMHIQSTGGIGTLALLIFAALRIE
jgi:hypothetical protein